MIETLSPVAVVFDFDGVIADSEALANTVLAEAVTSLGRPTSLDDALRRYQGKRWHEVVSLVEQDIGRPLPDDFTDQLKADTLQRLKTELAEVDGAISFIRDLELPKCIASSSPLERLNVSLHALRIHDEFDGRIFSADTVANGKPAPDIFLHAAARLNVAPADCVVIEDSVTGVEAGLAAGMTVIGLCAASHCRDGHSDRLSAAGATHVASSWSEVAKFFAL